MAGIAYLDFLVEVERAADGYTLLVRSGGHTARGTMQLPFDRATLDQRLRRVQARLLEGPAVARYAGAAATAAATREIRRRREPATDHEIQAFGAELFDALFRDDVRALLAASQRRAEAEHVGLRVRLGLHAPELAPLPWEFLYDSVRGDYVTLAASTPLVRYVPLDRRPEPLAVRPPLRILGVVASPKGLDPLNVERERQRLELALESARGKGSIELVWLGGQTARYVQAALRQGPWHILHFVGHGGFDETRNEGEGFIVLADDEGGGAHRVYARDLAHLVGDHDPMRAVVLNACEGARGNELDLFSSTAARLVKLGTPAVVAMQFEITDDAAIEFSRSFYEALADGYAIDTSLGEARKAMAIHLVDSLEWATPVLYTHAADGVLFKVTRSLGGADASRARMTAKPAIVYRTADAAGAAAVAAALDRAHVPTTRLTTGGSPTRLGEVVSCMLLLGPSGVPVWSLPAIQRVLSRRSHDPAFRIAPVLLPGGALPDLGRLPRFLVGRQWIDLRSGVDDPARIEELLDALSVGAQPPLRPGLPDDVPPFRGLEVFDEEHAGVFFGREAFTQQLVEHLRTNRLLAVVGPSGSGKSSVVRAGLLPQVRSGALPGSATWPILVLKPGTHPIEALAARLATLADAPPAGADAGPEPAATGPASSASDAARDAALSSLLQGAQGLEAVVDGLLAGGPPDRRVMLVVDQFEEVFTLTGDQAERDRFVELLLEATSPEGGRTVVVLTMRADFMDEAAALPALAARLAEHDALIPPMTREEMRRAIVEPARRAGLQYEAGLVDLMLAEVGGESGALPLLEDALLELWRGRSGGWLTLARYREIGGVRGAIAKRANAVYDAFSPVQQGIARRILLRLVALGEGAVVTRRRATRAELQPADPAAEGGEGAHVLQALVEARLVIAGRDGTSDIIDLAHEALVTNWPRFRTWIDENRAALRIHRRIAEVATEWSDADHDPSYLLRGARLVEATTWAAQNPHDANDVERAFVDASIAADRAESRARRTRTRRLVGAGVAVVAILAVATLAAVYSAVQADDARAKEARARTEAQARALSAQGVAEAATKPLPGLGDALEGYVTALEAGLPTADDRRTVQSILATGRMALIEPNAARVLSVPGGSVVVVDVAGAPGKLVRLSDGAVLATLAGDVAEVHAGAPGAGVVGITYQDGSGELRRVADGAAVELAGLAPEFLFSTDPLGVLVVVYNAVVPPDSDIELPPGGARAEVRMGSDGSIVRAVDGSIQAVSLLPGPDGGRVVAVFDDGHAELLRLSDGATVAAFPASAVGRPQQGPATVISVATPSENGLACSIRRTSDGAVVSPQTRPVTYQARMEPCGILATNDDGSVAAVSTRMAVKLVRVDDPGTPLAVTHTELVAAAVGPGTSPGLLAFGGARLEVWHSGDRKPVATIPGLTEGEFSVDPDVTFSADGRYASLLLGGRRHLVRMATGEDMALPERGVGDEVNVITHITFATGRRGTLVHLVDNKGEGQVAVLDDVPPGQVVVGEGGQFTVWPGGEEPVAIGDRLSYAGPSLGLRIVDVDPYQDIEFSPGTYPAVAIVRFPGAASSVGEPDRVSLVIFRNGTTVPLRAPVSSVAFSDDPGTSALVVGYTDSTSEVWDTAQRRSIGGLGLGVGTTLTDGSGERLVVHYLTGAAYLVDVQRLRTLPPDLSALSDADLRSLVCETLGERASTLAPTACPAR